MEIRAGAPPGSPGQGLLFERGSGQPAIAALLTAAVAGEGSLGVVEGPGGIGKTALLDDARRRAGARGLRVVHARACELEAGFAYGVVLELLDPIVARLTRGRPEPLCSRARHGRPRWSWERRTRPTAARRSAYCTACTGSSSAWPPSRRCCCASTMSSGRTDRRCDFSCTSRDGWSRSPWQ